jgi:low temperature requirement protein LtrA
MTNAAPEVPGSDPGDDPTGGGPGPGDVPAAQTEPDADDEAPVRVGTLEIFFDLVFAFTLIQLTSVLATQLSWLAVVRVLLIFGLLWWMYGAYAWLTNSRPPVHPAERIGLLAGMAGFLVIGIAIPRSFSGYGVVLGLGYLLVVLVHAFLYYRVNTNIIRVAPFNTASALLVIIAGLLHGPGGRASLAAYLLWVAALVIGAAGPVSRPGGANWKLLAIAVLGLVVAAALWWLVFGSGDDERAEQALTRVSSARRPAMALGGFFYGFIPLLLGLVGLAAGVLKAVTLAGTAGGSTGQSAVLACAAALFLAGNAAIRRYLRIGPFRLRVLAAVLELATIAIGIAAGLDVQLVIVAAVLVLPLAAERGQAEGPVAGPDAAG